MKPLKKFSQYYVELLIQLGTVRCSIMLATMIISLTILLQAVVAMLVQGEIREIDIVRSVFLGVMITPGLVYFLSFVIKQLEASRTKLKKTIEKLHGLMEQDKARRKELKETIEKLSQEIEDRKQAESDRQFMMNDLKNEVYEREKTQIALARQTVLMRSFLDASPDLIFYRNTQGAFSGCNRAFEKIVGKKESEIIGLAPEDLYPTNIVENITQTDHQVFNGLEEVTYNLWLTYPEGKKAYFEFRKLPFYDKNGDHLGLVGFGRDITEHKVYQDALEKASRDKTAFISTISHELRTPLNGIVGLSRMLLDTKLMPQQMAYMQTIHTSAVTLGYIFNDIIDLDKRDRKALTLAPAPTDLKQFLQELEHLSRLMAHQKGLHFELSKLTQLPDALNLDSARLRQVLWNLINNAVKFTQDGSVCINVSASLLAESAILTFEIEDTGVGICEKEIENIFKLYYQIKSSPDQLHAVGTGIGLAVSQELIQLMGGEIQVESEEGFGSTFTVTLQAPYAIVSKLSPVAFKSPQALSILIVEDVELNITVARSMLEKMGHSVDVARNGKEALALDVSDFDLIFLDIQLPDMTGFDIAKKWQEKRVNLPPLVALTANVVSDKKAYDQSGITDVLSKPFSLEEMHRIINHCFERNQSKHAYTKQSDIPQSTNPQISHSPIINLEISNSAPSKASIIKISDAKKSEHLNLDILTSYIQMVGKQLVLDSVTMFETSFPEYLSNLNQAILKNDGQRLGQEAHKLKGASAAIGLKSIQHQAKLLEEMSKSAWQAQDAAQYIERIHQLSIPALLELKQLLDSNVIND